MSSHQNGHPKLEIMQALVCSTAHITGYEALLLEGGLTPFNHTVWKSEYGFLFYVGSRGDLEGNISDGFKAVIEKAWQYALDWVRLDRDGEIIEGIPTYDW